MIRTNIFDITIMANYFHFGINFLGKLYDFNCFLGILTCKESTNDVVYSLNSIRLNADKQFCIETIKDPFLMPKRKKKEYWKSTWSHRLITLWARFLTLICAHCYPIAYLCSHLRIPIFENAADASTFFFHVYPDFKRQQVLCLPRAIFIATTSRRFKKYGAMFIGVFLPTVRMHAWVVEDGMCADIYDNQWIYYQPVAMMI